MTSKTYVIIPDVQIPFEDGKSLRAVISFIGDYQPDEVVQIGDLMDYPQPSRWNKDTRGEFEGSVYEDSEYAKKRFLQPLRDVYAGPLGVIEGNHDERPRVYLEKYAPALAGTNAFDFDQLLDFAAFDTVKLPEFYDFCPGWTMTHGHRGGIRLSPIVGRSAFNASKRFGKNVIMGHTHKLAALHETVGYGGRELSRTVGIEVGNLMDMRRAQYLRGATANWQQGLVVLHVTGRTVEYDVIPIRQGRFRVDGVEYGGDR